MRRLEFWMVAATVMGMGAVTEVTADCLTVKWTGIVAAKMNVRSSAGLLSNCPGQTSYIHIETDRTAREKVDTSFLVTGKKIRVDGLESLRDGSGSEAVTAKISGTEVPSGKSIDLQLSGFKGALPNLVASPVFLTVWVDGKPSFQATLSGSATYEKTFDQLSMK